MSKSKHPALSLIPPESRVLTLTLSKLAFEITGTKQKPFELRKKGLWIESRLRKIDHANGEYTRKEFDYVLFTNGYGHHRPWKLVEYRGFEYATENTDYLFANGLRFLLEKNDYIINLGQPLVGAALCGRPELGA